MYKVQFHFRVSCKRKYRNQNLKWKKEIMCFFISNNLEIRNKPLGSDSISYSSARIFFAPTLVPIMLYFLVFFFSLNQKPEQRNESTHEMDDGQFAGLVGGFGLHQALTRPLVGVHLVVDQVRRRREHGGQRTHGCHRCGL